MGRIYRINPSFILSILTIHVNEVLARSCHYLYGCLIINPGYANIRKAYLIVSFQSDIFVITMEQSD